MDQFLLSSSQSIPNLLKKIPQYPIPITPAAKRIVKLWPQTCLNWTLPSPISCWNTTEAEMKTPLLVGNRTTKHQGGHPARCWVLILMGGTTPQRVEDIGCLGWVKWAHRIQKSCVCVCVFLYRYHASIQRNPSPTASRGTWSDGRSNTNHSLTGHTE